ncbi:MAG: hypothetical protein E3J23_08310 [Candidatus Stahlbacteria bacterium]|nr:MAG: hypothetical protein E3J23_08310 [Candidatus Stahlbacteria bacterium]
MHSIDDVKEKEDNIYRAIVIMGKEAEWLSSLEHSTIRKPMYKAIEHFIGGKIHYVIKDEEEEDIS